jgi:hypothetical protein
MIRIAASEIVDRSMNGIDRERTGGMPVEGDLSGFPYWLLYETRDGRWLSIYPVRVK